MRHFVSVPLPITEARSGMRLTSSQHASLFHLVSPDVYYLKAFQVFPLISFLLLHFLFKCNTHSRGYVIVERPD